jgi:hypothetical protein
MDTPTIGKKEEEKPNEQIYNFQGKLPFNIDLKKTLAATEGEQDLIDWKVSYSTSLINQFAVFGYCVDLFRNLIEKRIAENKEWYKIPVNAMKYQKKQAKPPCSETEIKKFINYRNMLMNFMDEMLPYIWTDVQSEDFKKNKIEIVSDLSSVKQ